MIFTFHAPSSPLHPTAEESGRGKQGIKRVAHGLESLSGGTKLSSTLPKLGQPLICNVLVYNTT